MGAKDRTGERYGRLVLLRRADTRGGDGTYLWVCRCDCGEEKEFLVNHLRNGHTQSCGCLHRERTSEMLKKRNTTHGHAFVGSRTPTYRVWRSIFDRLKYDASYRDVVMCDRWLKFENFLADMGEKPEGLTLDRKDNSKGYEPGNCRWVSMLVQQNNRTNNIRLSHLGRCQTLSEWARELGVAYEPMRRKYRRWGSPSNFISMFIDKLFQSGIV